MAIDASGCAPGTGSALVEITRRIYAGELKSDPSNLGIAVALPRSKTRGA
jgi:hypothetical protein